MRTRALAAIVLLLLPALAEAQVRIPRIGRRVGPPRGEPLPPQAPAIARELAYKRLNYSVETYPLIAHFDASGFLAPGATYDWTSGGMGSRLDYRMSRHFSLTFDMTSSFVGGPTMTSTAELGTRIRPERNERRLYPFTDLRLGYMLAYETSARPYDIVDPTNPSTPVGNGNYSQGVGAIGGGGLEYALTRSFSLISSASVMQAQMHRHTFRTTPTGPSTYRMTSYRYMLGLRFNPVRMIPRLGQQDLPVTGRP